MTKYMSKKRFIILCITIVLDIALAVYAMFFAVTRPSIKGVVLALMLFAMVYEVYDATKDYRANLKKEAHKARSHKEDVA